MNTNKVKTLFAIFLSFTIVTGCKSDPIETRDKAYSKAQEYMAEEEYETAIIEFRNALKADNGHIDSYMGLGEAFEKMGDIQNARATFEQVISLDSKNIPAKLKIGDYMLAAGIANPENPAFFKRAQTLAEEIIEIDPSNIEGLIMLGKAYSGQDETEEAIKRYSGALSLDPDNLSALLNLAAAEDRNKNPQKAEEILKRALATHPDDIGAHITIALFYLSKNRIEDSIDFLKQAFEIDPANSRALLTLARLYIAQKKPEEAEKAFKTAIERKPEAREPLWLLANFYLEQGKVDTGMETLNNLMALFPEDGPAQLRIAEIFMSRGEQERAEEYIQSVLESDGKNQSAIEFKRNKARAHFMLGTILRKDQNLDRALEEFDNAIKLDASLERAYLEKANIELSRGDLDACGSTLQSVLQRNGNSLAARGAWAKLLVLRGNPKDALQQAQDVLARDAANEDALGARAESLLFLGRLDESKKDWLKLCELRPGNSSYRYRLGAVDAMKKDYASALTHFRKAVELKPDFIKAISDIVYIHVQRGQYKEALAELDRLGGVEAVKDEIHRIRGQVFLAVRDEASAEKEWKKAVEINPHNYEATIRLGQLYQNQNKIPQAIEELDRLIAQIEGLDQQGDQKDKLSAACLQKAYFLQISDDIQGAIGSYRKAIKLNPQNYPALNNLAWILADNGINLEEALSLAKEAKKKAPEDPEIADTLGWIYYKMGNYTLAENQLLLSVNKREKPQAEHYYRLGKALFDKGDSIKAYQTLRKALELDANFDGADDAREILKGEE